MNQRKHLFAVGQSVVMAPALFFLAAVVVQQLGPLQQEPAHTAHQIVMWYAVRMWTLWVLLLILPFLVLVTGCAILSPRVVEGLRRHTLAAIRASRVLQVITAITATAATVLLIVIMHMAAN